MKSMKLYKNVLLALGAFVVTSRALTPADLQTLIDAGEKVTVIDIRTESFYQSGHIPNAINIPERVLERKNLPPLGRVVVYDQGVNVEHPEKAVELLNAKEGIQAERLEGGYAAWETAKGSTTQPPGFQAENLNYITYQNLEKIDSADLVLVDLRKPKEVDTGRLNRQGESITAAEPLTSLAKTFPGKTVVTSPFAVTSAAGESEGGLQRMSETPEPPPVMVLIDNGDGESEKMARILKANGVRRVIILAGGEEILKRGGESGLMRMGAGAQTVEGNDE